ncbi:MAG: sigma 54-interacting transcriptional regulator [Acidobacteriia bacterium]|nr:sigma 54-interacting transcriptional regulator [Terriglobia bacterium]
MLATMPKPELHFAPPETLSPIIGATGGLGAVMDSIRKVAPTDAAVLLQGETGTGKEVIARAVHEQSRRRRGPYIRVNCAALPAGLLESELFGHERGAFTGAISQRNGRFQLADQGTLFLDEVGDLPLDLQPKLLRVLQEQEFERLGSARTIRVDVRIVAATNLDLAELVRERRFRADLFYRLNVFPVTLPPLRERDCDIPALAHHFMHKFAARMDKQIETIPDEVMEVLRLYSWPGNIRELQNFIERSVILSSGAVLRPPLGELKVLTPGHGSNGRRTLEEAERAHILDALRQTGSVIGGRNGAAALLGVRRTTLIYRMQKLGIGQARAASV